VIGLCLSCDMARLTEAGMIPATGGRQRAPLTPPHSRLRFISAGLRLCGELIDLGPVASGQKPPSLTLSFEIAQAPIGQANCLAIPPDIEFPVGRTTDLKSARILFAHVISPIRFRQSGFIRQ
jgi:hypothetical protein